jgi:hypothetical protein
MSWAYSLKQPEAISMRNLTPVALDGNGQVTVFGFSQRVDAV